jgi:hypothetical protein
MKKFLFILCALVASVQMYGAEPSNNLGKSYSRMVSDWPDMHYLRSNGVRQVYGVQDDGISYIFTFENNGLVEECMMVESRDGFAKMWYNETLNSFYKTSYRSVSRTSNGFKFHYSYFDVKIMYFSDYSGNTSMIIYTTDF